MVSLFEHSDLVGKRLQRRYDWIDEDLLVERIGCARELHGHEGCVNTLKWNAAGTLLASGSDDTRVKLWGLDGSLRTTLHTNHMGNVFGVDFLPGGNDEILISCAADHLVKIHRISSEDEFTWECDGRVKRLATAQDEPFLFWSASEDGFVRQYDTRTNDVEKLISARNRCQVKSMAICQGRTNLVAVCMNLAKVSIYDRRSVNKCLVNVAPADSICQTNIQYTTHAAFNYHGSEVIVNHGGGAVYLFDLNNTKKTVLEKLEDVFSTDFSGDVNQQPTNATKFEREVAKAMFNDRRYFEAIDVYTRALTSPKNMEMGAVDKSFLFGNRGMGYLCRRWEGDTYASIRDSIEAILLYPGNSKALFRLTRALMLLEQWTFAKRCVDLFKTRFAGDSSIDHIEEQINIALNDTNGHSLPSMCDSPLSIDYSERYTGHSNLFTDIKEANYFGSHDQYIVAGSDCGSMVLWDRRNGMIRAAWKADANTCNIVQPHPSLPLIATSGIEHVIRFWEPLAQTADERRIVDIGKKFGQRNTEDHNVVGQLLRMMRFNRSGNQPEASDDNPEHEAVGSCVQS